MAKRSALLVCIVLIVLPAFSDGPKKADSQPEFYFTRLMYTDIYGRGPNSPWQKSARPEITVGFKGLNGHFSTL